MNQHINASLFSLKQDILLRLYEFIDKVLIKKTIFSIKNKKLINYKYKFDSGLNLHKGLSLKLKLDKANIKNKILKLLSKSLQIYTNITHLQMDLSNNYELSEFYPLFRFLPSLTYLRYLSLNFSNTKLKLTNLNEFESIRSLKLLKKLSLDVSYCNLLDNDCKILVKNLNELTELTFIKLVFKGNKLVNLEPISTMLRKLRNNLKSLSFDISCNQVENIFYLSKSIELLTNNFYSLTLDLTDNKIKDKEGSVSLTGAISNLQGLEKLNISLGETQYSYFYINFDILFFLNELVLDLSSLSIELESITRIFLSMGYLVNLLLLDVNCHDKRIGIEGARCLSLSISKMINLRKINLNLNENEIKDEGLILLSEKFRLLENLCEVSLSLKENRITMKGGKYLFKSLIWRLKALKIDISKNAKVGDVSAKYFYKNLIIKNLTNLYKLKTLILNFRKTDLKEKYLNLIINSFNKLTLLDHLDLDLSENVVSPNCLKSLSNFLTNNNSLRSLKIQLNNCILSEEAKNEIPNLLVTRLINVSLGLRNISFNKDIIDSIKGMVNNMPMLLKKDIILIYDKKVNGNDKVKDVSKSNRGINFINE